VLLIHYIYKYIHTFIRSWRVTETMKGEKFALLAVLRTVYVWHEALSVHCAWSVLKPIVQQSHVEASVRRKVFGITWSILTKISWVCVNVFMSRVIKSRKMRWVGHVARIGERGGVYRVLIEKSERKRPLGRPRRRWKDNINTNLQEEGCGVWTGSS
jgi:hypothetical protein